MLAPLQELEETVTRLVVELLLLEKEREKRYKGLLLDNPEDNRCVRVTMHYVMALLNYGFLPESVLLQKLADWFDRPFPKSENDHIDPAEMNRLMILLHLRPYNDNVQTRLKQLVKQKVDDGFDVQPSWSGFDTLWAIKLLKLAAEKGVLHDGIISMAEIEDFLDRLVRKRRELRRDKDIALAMRLQHELFGPLSPKHRKHLSYLVETGRANKGVWGLEELGWRLDTMEWLDKFLKSNKLTAAEVKPFQEQFRRVVLSTCIVIENLAPLAPAYPELQAPVERAMKLWWEQFYGQHAVETLHTLFPQTAAYDYVMVLTRTIRALRSYMHEPLCTLDTVQVHILNELAETKVDLSDPPEVQNIKEALRRWIQVDLTGQIEPLKLGLSEAHVVRVQPHIWSPMINDPYAAHSLITQSLIIKYGPEEVINTERDNYEKIPAATRDCFVRIPKASYTVPQGPAFVIIQDLRDYQTLYEARETVAQDVSEIADQLGSFLRQMHAAGSDQYKPAASSLLRELYLRKMMEHVDRIFDYVWLRSLLSEQAPIREIQDGLFETIGDLIRCGSTIGHFPTACMHGDLHMRNIMISGLNHEQNGQLNGLTFKLIDLEYLRPDGDAAFDAGQLLVDIAMVAHDENRYQTQTQLMRLHDSLKLTYDRFAQNRTDETFPMRVELARARTLLRIAKGKIKRGDRHYHARQFAQAEAIAGQVLEHARQAQEHLQIVVGSLR